MAKKALGKGLDALISGIIDEKIEENINSIPIEKIVPNRFQPRKDFNQNGIEELAKSIKEKGLIQPVVVRREGENYELIVGERRVRAAKSAGVKEVPAVIKDLSENEILELALIENIQREDLTPIEEATAYKMIIQKNMITQERLSQRVGKSRSYIANMIRLLELPEDIREYVSRGTISVGQAKAILSLKTEEERRKLAERITRENLTVRDVENIIRESIVPRGTKTPLKDPFIEEFEERIRTILGTKVQINYRDGKGFIKIDFYSSEDLERIMEIFES